MPLPPLERRFFLFTTVGLPIAALGAGALGGWRGGLALLLMGFLVSADFIWIARGLRAVVNPEIRPRPGSGFRAAAGLMGRTLLLILGLYAILNVLPGEGASAAAGIGVPLAALAVAGLAGKRS